MVTAFFFVAVTSSLVKMAVGTGLPTAVVVFFESLIPLLVLTGWHMRRGIRNFSLPSRHYGLQFLQGGLAFCTSYLMYLAIRTVPVSSGVLLNSSAPLFIPIISYFWFRRRVSPGLLISLAVGFTGIVLILNPSAATFAHPGILLALASGIAVAFDDIIVGILDGKGTERQDVTLFFIFLMTTVLSGLIAIPIWKTPSGVQWLYLLSVGCGFLLIELFLVRSFSFAAVSTVSPFMYFGVIFAGLIDWLGWGVIPDMQMIIGVVLVIAGAIASIKVRNEESSGYSNRANVPTKSRYRS